MSKNKLPITARRESKGLTREQLAKKANVSVGYLSSVENGKAGVSADVAERIAKTLGIRITEDAREKHNVAFKKYIKGLPSSQPAPKSPKPKAIKAVPAPRSAPAPKAPKKNAQDLSAQYQLPGIAEMIGAEIHLQVQDMIRAALQRSLSAQSVETEQDAEATPIFKKVK